MLHSLVGEVTGPFVPGRGSGGESRRHGNCVGTSGLAHCSRGRVVLGGNPSGASPSARGAPGA